MQDGNTSEDRQDKLTRRICEDYGLILKKTFQDRCISAAEGDNLVAQFAELSRVVQSGEYIIVEDATRISRMEKLPALNAIWSVVGKGINLLVGRRYGRPIEITKDNFNDPEIWNAISAELDNAHMSNEYATIGKREAWAIRKARLAKGEVVRWYNLPSWLSNSPKIRGEEPYYILDEEKANVVRRIFTMYIKGLGCLKIAHALNMEGVPSIHSAYWRNLHRLQWSPPAIQAIIKDLRVCGKCRIPPYHKVYPAIVDEDTFRTANDIRQTRCSRKFAGKNTPFINVFAGVCVCSLCGSNMAIGGANTTRHKGNMFLRYLRCSRNDKVKCSHKGIRFERFEYSMKELLGRADMIHEVITKTKDIVPDRLNALNAHLDENGKKLRHFYDIMERLETPTMEFIDRVNKITREQKELLHQIEQEKIKLQGAVPSKDAMATYQKQFADRWNDLDCRYEIRELLRKAIEKIVIDTDKQCYSVFFTNSAHTIDVVVAKKSFSINGLEFPYPKP
jgi:hypothetical protein